MQKIPIYMLTMIIQRAGGSEMEGCDMMMNMNMMSMGYGMGLFGTAIYLLVIVILIFLAIYLYQKITQKKR